jgi:hypothetical protein
MQRGRGSYRGRYTPLIAASLAEITSVSPLATSSAASPATSSAASPATSSATLPPITHPLDQFPISELISRKKPDTPILIDTWINKEVIRRKYRYTEQDLLLCLESKRYVLFKIIIKIPAQTPIRLNLRKAIMQSRNTVELGLIYETHVFEICEMCVGPDYYQQFIYMCFVFKNYTLAKQIISSHPKYKNAGVAILHGFTWKLDICRPYIGDPIIADGRIPVGKIVDTLCEIFPEYEYLVKYLFEGESYSDEVITFVLQHKLPMWNIRPEHIPRFVKELGLSAVYEMITHNDVGPNFTLNYIELVKLGLDTRAHTFPVNRVMENLDILADGCYLETVLCKKIKSYGFAFDSFMNIITFILEDKSSDKYLDYVPSSRTKKYISCMSLNQMVYYMKRGDFTPYFIMNYLLYRGSYKYVISQSDIPYFKTMIEYGLCVDMRYKFGGDTCEETKQEILCRWFYKRPEDTQTLMCLGLKMDKDEVYPYVHKSVTYDIPLFNISSELRHAMAFQFPIKRINEYMCSVMDPTCDGIILVYMYKNPRYFLFSLPADIVGVIYSYFGAI